MKQTARILPRVYLVGSSDMTSSGDCMVYLVDCRSELALIDAGVSSDTSKICSNIESLGLEPKNISTLLITHCHIDHAGGAASFREKLGCKTIAHELDSDAIERADLKLTGAFVYHQDLVPCRIDVKLSGSDGKIRVGDKTMKWIHTPGHTPGSISILPVATFCSHKIFMGLSCASLTPTSQIGSNPRRNLSSWILTFLRKGTLESTDQKTKQLDTSSPV